MREAMAVIGSGYGDEGKGLMTDYLARQGADVVVRTNGGAQAGHTVVLPDGRRHVFHHVGSGALAGLPTHLSRYFVSNPMFLLQELDSLRRMGARTDISADPRGYVTTPYDVMINQIVEEARGASRHGSCGLGFGETIERCENSVLGLTVAEMTDGTFRLADRLDRIRREWLPQRLLKLGIKDVPRHWLEIVRDDAILERYLHDIAGFSDAVSIVNDRDLAGEVLFEGAQGLMLDQDYGHFPHVTRSNTGLRNMVEVAAEAGIGLISAVYVTRAYATRHGAGPLEHEADTVPGITPIDETNVPNDWQGMQRVAPLDLDILKGAVEHDMRYGTADVKVDASLALTCLDQVEDRFAFFKDGHVQLDGEGAFAAEVSAKTGLEVEYLSHGPSCASVETVKANRKPAAA